MNDKHQITNKFQAPIPNGQMILFRILDFFYWSLFGICLPAAGREFGI
jgi:hypothetical protein